MELIALPQASLASAGFQRWGLALGLALSVPECGSPKSLPGSPQRDEQGWDSPGGQGGEGEQLHALAHPSCLLGEHKVRPDPPGARGSSGGLWRAQQWGLHPGPDRLGGEGVGLASWHLLGRRGALATSPHHLQIHPVALPTEINQENARVFLPWRIASCVFSLWQGRKNSVGSD